MKKLVLGTVQFGLDYGINNKNGKLSTKDVHRILDIAFESGIRVLDTSSHYGNAIEIIAQYHHLNKTKRFSIINKYRDVEDVEKQIEDDLQLLDVASFEAVLWHSPSVVLSQDKILKGLERAKEDQHVKKIGISLYTNTEVNNIVNEPVFDIIQLPFNLLDNEYQRGALLNMAVQKGKEVHTRSVFLQGLFFMSMDRLPLKLKPLAIYLDKIHHIAKDNKISINALSLNYVLQKNYISSVLIGVDSVEQLESNIKDVEIPIDISVLEEIDKIQVETIELLNPVNWK